MTEGRTPGEFPSGVPISGRGGMKGVAGSESGMMMDECWSFFFHGFSCSHPRIGDKERSGNERTHEETMVGMRALFSTLSGLDHEFPLSKGGKIRCNKRKWHAGTR